MLTFNQIVYKDTIPNSIEVVLVGDVGGTNSNFGIFQCIDNKNVLLTSLHFKSQQITHFTVVIEQILTHLKTQYNFSVSTICLGAAGVVSQTRDYCKPTNLPIAIDAKEIGARTNVPCVFIVNDFEVIGYGLTGINQKDLVLINKGKSQEDANKAIVGAGTGLGKCIMFWEVDRKMYVPVASEGGHADAVVQCDIEYELVRFLQKLHGNSCAISWEDVLSGKGIQNMYKFFLARNTNEHASAQLVQGLMPDEIFNSRHLDTHAWNTFELYAKFYARCIKNFALDALARGGVYIAGGIAAKNLQLFEQKIFLDEFINCGKQQELLKNIPIYVITDYNISLYGAAEYVRIEKMCLGNGAF